MRSRDIIERDEVDMGSVENHLILETLLDIRELLTPPEPLEDLLNRPLPHEDHT